MQIYQSGKDEICIGGLHPNSSCSIQNIFQPRASTAFLYTHNTVRARCQRKKITKHSLGVCFPHGAFRVKSLGSDKSKQYIITYSKLGVIYYITLRSVSHKYTFVREKIGAADTRSAIVLPFVGRFVPLETALEEAHGSRCKLRQIMVCTKAYQRMGMVNMLRLVSKQSVVGNGVRVCSS
jgi:hypothetical protein